MIIKNLSRRSGTGQLLNYVFKYIGKEEKVGHQSEQFLIRHNLGGRDVPSFIKAFKENESSRVHKRSNATAINHVILSWSGSDKQYVTESMMKDIAKKFIEIRGENNLYAGTAHYDRDHTHLHLVVSGSNEYLTNFLHVYFIPFQPLIRITCIFIHQAQVMPKSAIINIERENQLQEIPLKKMALFFDSLYVNERNFYLSKMDIELSRTFDNTEKQTALSETEWLVEKGIIKLYDFTCDDLSTVHLDEALMNDAQQVDEKVKERFIPAEESILSCPKITLHFLHRR